MNDIIELLKAMKSAKVGIFCSPHKYALLLTIAQLFSVNPSRSRKIYLNDELEKLFQINIHKLSPSTTENLAQIEYPFFYLQNDGFWILKIKQGMEDRYEEIVTLYKQRFTKKRLIEVVEYANISEMFYSCLIDNIKREALVKEILLQYNQKMNVKNREGDINMFNNVERRRFSSSYVDYLNTLISIYAHNENALAESQASNPLFSTIHVQHPLMTIIREELIKKNGRHIILTGHAGDGKSTIALELYKYFLNIPVEEILEIPMQPREDLKDTGITIIKDFSERDSKDDVQLNEELITHQRKFLIISNTGTLLNFFKKQAQYMNVGRIDMESKVLKAISAENGRASLDLGEERFIVYNLALMDNLGLAKQIFLKMIAEDRWEKCRDCEKKEFCSILKNINLIQSNSERIVDRLFLAYRRMYEYGIRLTIRQITEHFAYMITSGLDCTSIQNKDRELYARYLFFNRFFGDDGLGKDTSALSMKAIIEVNKQGFGERPNPNWERRLWQRSRGNNFQLDIALCNEVFEDLRQIGLRTVVNEKENIKPEQARMQIRRMMFFLYAFKADETSFLGNYLNSFNLLQWQKWQMLNARLDQNYRSAYNTRIFHVIQEHFTGVRIPEDSGSGDSRLYITLNRSRINMRQSAQIVIAQLDWSTSTSLELISQENASGETRTELHLKVKGGFKGIELKLTLPFLDYVTMRHYGEIGELLQASYLERLERFNAQVLALSALNQNSIMLVRLKNDNTFKRQSFSINNGKLEVSDVH